MLLGFTGDLFLGGGARSLDTFAGIAGGLGAEVRLLVNFEGTLYDDARRLTPARRKVLLDSPVEHLPSLERLPIVAASIGNNHIGDYGPEIARFTFSRLSARWLTFGAGLASQDAFHLAQCRVGDAELGLANYCTADTTPLFCTDSIIGPRPLNLRRAAEDLHRLRSKCDHCIAIVHWGYEDFHHPRPVQLRLGRALIRMGFKLVIGHHSHTAQGYERCGEGWIFYSLGNFFFPDHRVLIDGGRYQVQWMPRRSWGVVPFFRITAGKLDLESVRFVTHRRDAAPRWLESRRLRSKFDGMCLALAEPLYVQHYRRLCRREGWVIRGEEFLNNDRKLAAIWRKVRKAIGGCPRDPANA